MKKVSNLEVKNDLNKWIEKRMNKDDKASNYSSIMKVSKPLKPEATNVNASQPDKSNWFWFKRSDFYVTGMDFVFARIAIVS